MIFAIGSMAAHPEKSAAERVPQIIVIAFFILLLQSIMLVPYGECGKNGSHDPGDNAA